MDRVLTASGLSVRLGGRPVLDQIELSFRLGEVVAIVGPNGAGKSTLMASLAGLRPPSQGQVRLGAQVLSSLSDRERARRIGFLPQSPEIAWGLEVRSFVGLGRTAHRGPFGGGPQDEAAIDRALALTDMIAFAGREVTSLSGGERARTLIGRALAGEPEWLLADEPLTGLDPGHQLDAGDLLRQVARAGAGVLVTLHDLAFAARVADRVVVMAQGRILADGAAPEALSPDVLATAYGVEARWVTGAAGPLLDIIGRFTGEGGPSA